MAIIQPTPHQVYHSFHEEVKEYKQHWWKCDGPCQHRPPFYGLVKRAMNRPPSGKDRWWSKHQDECGGKYIKIKEPEGYQNKGKGSKEKTSEAGKSGNIKELLEKSSSSFSSQSKSSRSPTKMPSQPAAEVKTDFSGEGHVLGGKKDSASETLRPSKAAAYAAQKRHFHMNESPPSKKMKGSMNGKDKNNKTKCDSSKDSDTSSLNHNGIFLSKNGGKEATKRTAIPSVLLDSVPHSSHITPEQDTQLVDLTDSIGTLQQETNTTISLDDGASHGSSSHEKDGELVDLTDSKLSCPICGFSDLHEELLKVHIKLCLNEFYS